MIKYVNVTINQVKYMFSPVCGSARSLKYPSLPSRKSGKEAGEYDHRYHSSGVCVKMCLTVRDGTDVGLTGVGIYFIRTSTKRTLGCAKTAHRTL